MRDEGCEEIEGSRQKREGEEGEGVPLDLARRRTRRMG